MGRPPPSAVISTVGDVRFLTELLDEDSLIAAKQVFGVAELVSKQWSIIARELANGRIKKNGNAYDDSTTRHSSNDDDAEKSDGPAPIQHVPATEVWFNGKRVPYVANIALLEWYTRHCAEGKNGSASSGAEVCQRPYEYVFVVCSDTCTRKILPLPLADNARVVCLGLVEADLAGEKWLITRRSDMSSPEDLAQVFDNDSLKGLVEVKLGDFRPLGGHSDCWKFSPRFLSNTVLVKKSKPSECVFYDLLHRWSDPLATSATCLEEVLDRNSHDDLGGLVLAQNATEWLADNVNSEAIPVLARRLLSFAPVITKIQFNSTDSYGYVEMENVAATELSALVGEMDLKVGTRLYGLDADANKVARMTEKAKRNTAGKTGLCIIAYRVRDGSMHKQLTRESARGLNTLAQLQHHLTKFLTHAGGTVVESLKEQLMALRSFFVSQKFIHLSGSSLLIVYFERKAVIKLIDFTHVSFCHNDPDISTLTGLNNLYKFVETFEAVDVPSTKVESRDAIPPPEPR